MPLARVGHRDRQHLNRAPIGRHFVERVYPLLVATAVAKGAHTNRLFEGWLSGTGGLW